MLYYFISFNSLMAQTSYSVHCNKFYYPTVSKSEDSRFVIHPLLEGSRKVRDPPIQVNDYNYVPIFLITALSYSSLDFLYNSS
jgi:hypothetical protein